MKWFKKIVDPVIRHQAPAVSLSRPIDLSYCLLCATYSIHTQPLPTIKESLEKYLKVRLRSLIRYFPDSWLYKLD